MKIWAKNVGKGAKNAFWDNIGRLDKDLLLLKGLYIIITQNRQMSKQLVNGIMGTIYNLNWDNQVTDTFNIILAFVMMQQLATPALIVLQSIVSMWYLLIPHLIYKKLMR